MPGGPKQDMGVRDNIVLRMVRGEEALEHKRDAYLRSALAFGEKDFRC